MDNLTIEEINLIALLKKYGRDEASVRDNLPKWLRLQDRMNANCSFDDYIILNYRADHGKSLTDQELEYLDLLNRYAFWLDD